MSAIRGDERRKISVPVTAKYACNGGESRAAINVRYPEAFARKIHLPDGRLHYWNKYLLLLDRRTPTRNKNQPGSFDDPASTLRNKPPGAFDRNRIAVSQKSATLFSLPPPPAISGWNNTSDHSSSGRPLDVSVDADSRADETISSVK